MPGNNPKCRASLNNVSTRVSISAASPVSISAAYPASISATFPTSPQGDTTRFAIQMSGFPMPFASGITPTIRYPTFW